MMAMLLRFLVVPPDLHRRIRFSSAHSAAQLRVLNQHFARTR
jgi:hypothetical protein